MQTVRLIATVAIAALALVVSSCSTPAQPAATTAFPAPRTDTCVGLGQGPDASTASNVPPGAEGVRLCGSPDPGLSDAPGPSEALTGEAAAALATRFNALPTATLGGPCPADLGPRFLLVFSYADRQPVIVAGETYGCRLIGGRVGARIILDAFVRDLAAQRRGSTPTVTPTAPTRCNAGSWVTPEVADTGRAWACYGWPGGESDPVEVVGWADLARAATPSRVTTDVAPSSIQSVLLTQDAFGATRTLFIADRTLLWGAQDATGAWNQLSWRPSDEQWAAIGRALDAGRAAQGPRPLCPADGGVLDVAALGTATGLEAASRCITDASGRVTEYLLSEKTVGLMAGELTVGPPPPLPTCSPRPGRDEIVVRKADGSVGLLTGYCGRFYVGSGVYWVVSADSAGWLNSLPRR